MIPLHEAVFLIALTLLAVWSWGKASAIEAALREQERMRRAYRRHPMQTHEFMLGQRDDLPEDEE